MKKIFSYFVVFFLLLTQSAFSQKKLDVQDIVQKAINFEVLENHLKKNDTIIVWNIPAAIIIDEWISDDLILNKNGRPATFVKNDFDAMAQNGGYNYDFTNLNVRHKKAEVSFGYYPWLVYRDIESPFWGHRGIVHFKVDLNFTKKEDDWIIESFTIKDPVFEGQLDEHLNEFYIPFNK